MPTTIYDSSLITQRRRDKTISGSFINRIQNPTNPTTGSAPYLGITQQSIINTVKNGQMTEYRKNDGGCTTESLGCPCVPPVLFDPTAVPFISGDCGGTIFVGNNQLANFFPEFQNGNQCIFLGSKNAPILYWIVTGIIGGQPFSIQTFYPQTINTNGGQVEKLTLQAFNQYGGSNILISNTTPPFLQYTSTNFPKAPVISFISATNNTATINIIPDPNTGLSPLINYTVYFFDTNLGLPLLAAVTIPVTGPFIVPGLSPNTKYAIAVRARNTSPDPNLGAPPRSSLSNVIEFTTLP
jgi:hypothetical protein